jgi:hypothetical protein
LGKGAISEKDRACFEKSTWVVTSWFMETSYIFSSHRSSRLVSGSGSDNQNSYPTCPCTDIKIPYETRTERGIKSLKYLFQLFFGFLPKLPFELLTPSTSTLTGQNKDKKNVIINQNVKAENCICLLAY